MAVRQRRRPKEEGEIRILGIMSVLLVALALLVAGGCGDDGGSKVAVARISALADTGVRYPGTVDQSSEAPYDGASWLYPWQVRWPDGTCAYVISGFDYGDYCNVLRSTNFAFSIPAGSDIDGIEVEIGRYCYEGIATDILVRLTKDGSNRVGSNRADILTYWPGGSVAVATYGGATDLWGTTWTHDEINASTFGVHFAALAREPPPDDTDIYVDFVRIRVYYTACVTYYRDDDNDGYGQTADSKCLCTASDPYDATTNGDCDDTDVSVHPGATETCNTVDDDCDGEIDGEDATGCTTYYRDDDNDGYGQTADSKCLCTACDPYDTITDGDCDDTDADINPETLWYEDSDGDGYGNPDVSQQSCTQPDGYVLDNTDCYDNAFILHPDQTWYKDADRDGYSDGTTLTSCLGPICYWYNLGSHHKATTHHLPRRPTGDWYDVAAHLKTTHGDCDDNDPTVNPGATEVPFNGKDDDCNPATPDVP